MSGASRARTGCDLAAVVSKKSRVSRASRRCGSAGRCADRCGFTGIAVVSGTRRARGPSERWSGQRATETQPPQERFTTWRGSNTSADVAVLDVVDLLPRQRSAHLPTPRRRPRDPDNAAAGEQRDPRRSRRIELTPARAEAFVGPSPPWRLAVKLPVGSAVAVSVARVAAACRPRPSSRAKPNLNSISNRPTIRSHDG